MRHYLSSRRHLATHGGKNEVTSWYRSRRPLINEESKNHIVLQVEVNISPPSWIALTWEVIWFPFDHRATQGQKWNWNSLLNFWNLFKNILNLGIWNFVFVGVGVVVVFIFFFIFFLPGTIFPFENPLCATALFSERELYLKCSLPSMLAQP